MKNLKYIISVSLITMCINTIVSSQKVEFMSIYEERKVEVSVDGRFFTAFCYPDNLEKQVLYPLMTASGKAITRGYPIDPRPFERTDHPHHVGLWLNFGGVNGLDFWNNSFAIKAEDKPKYGAIRFREIVSMNDSKGELVTKSDWLDHDNNRLLDEVTTYKFSGSENTRTIERVTVLTSRGEVTFTENKEGLLGLRVDRAFEEPATKPEIFLDAKGNETKVPAMNNEGVNGVYRNADGIKGGDVWGKRSRWVALKAVKEGETITIVIIDHPGNPNYPAWSHARGYGLFASNNLGGRAFDKNADPVKIVLQKGETITFRHKVVIGGDLTDTEINRLADIFR